jgi:ureidoglycolate hydrolase
MLQDRSQAYREYGDYIDRMQKKLDTISQGQLNKANLLSGLVQNEQTQQGDYMSDLLGVLGDKAQTKVNTAIGAFS